MTTASPRISDLDVTALRALVAVLDTGSFTAAARSLGTSQPAVSLAVKRLEQRLDTVLVMRTRKGAQATRPGIILARGARRALDTLGEALATITEQEAEPSGRILLGCHESLASYALPAFMARFLRAYPRIELQLWNGTSMEVERELIEGRIDLGLVVNPSQHPDTVVTPLFDDSVELFHCLPSRRRGQPEELLVRFPLIFVPALVQSQDLLQRLAAAEVEISRPLPCSSLELVKNLVLDRVGIGVLPRRVAAHATGKKLHSLSPPLPSYRDRIALVRRYDQARTASFGAVSSSLIEHGRAMAV